MTVKKARRRNIRGEYGLKFIQIPKVLFFGDQYKNLTNNAKIAYALLQDRWKLSIQNNWVDENGDIYFLYTNKKLMEILNIGSSATLQKIKKELVDVGLLEQEQRGFNMANRLYLLEPVVEEADLYKIIEDETEEIQDMRQKEEAYKQKVEEIAYEGKPLDTQGSSFSKQPFSESGSSKNELQDVQKVNTNKTDFNNTLFKDSKDSKDRKTQNDLLTAGIEKNSQDFESSKELIQEFIENRNIEEIFGEPIVQNFKKYSHYDFNTFKVFYEKLFFAQRAIEEETGMSLMLNVPITAYGDEHQKELSKAFWRSIQQYKAGKIKSDFNNYLFGVFKRTFKKIAEDIQSEKMMYEKRRNQEAKTDSAIHVPLHNWLEDLE